VPETQVISGLFTLYALFGSDLAILAVDPSLDTYFEVTTQPHSRPW
jgi:hypothetical protein